MNILFIKHFFVGFMVSDIPRVSVFCQYRIRLLSPTYINKHSYTVMVMWLIIFVRLDHDRGRYRDN